MVNHYGNFNHQLVGGFSQPLKNDRVKVSWDDGIPNWMDKIIQMFQTTNQLVTYLSIPFPFL